MYKVYVMQRHLLPLCVSVTRTAFTLSSHLLNVFIFAIRVNLIKFDVI